MSNPPTDALNNLTSTGSARQPGATRSAAGGPREQFLCEDEAQTLHRVLAEAEIRAILQALQRTGWNRKRAARILDISYRGLLYKLRRHSITPTGNI